MSLWEDDWKSRGICVGHTVPETDYSRGECGLGECGPRDDLITYKPRWPVQVVEAVAAGQAAYPRGLTPGLLRVIRSADRAFRNLSARPPYGPAETQIPGQRTFPTSPVKAGDLGEMVVLLSSGYRDLLGAWDGIAFRAGVSPLAPHDGLPGAGAGAGSGTCHL
jgi:hypothetical protein